MFSRSRRLRETPAIRNLVRETRLDSRDFILPIFVVEGSNVEEEIKSLPGVYHYSVDKLQTIVDKVLEAGVHGVILFGLPDCKDEIASSAFDADGVVQKAIREIKRLSPDLCVITDVCMCQYTSHGHCGILKGHKVDNDSTLEYLAKIAVSHAEAGADMVAPSDMMDGRVLAIRDALDENGFEQVSIMAYSAKFASQFYGPFREAAGSSPSFGDRKTYQMDPANRKEALKEMESDIMEGADMIMVKPALSYLDIIREGADRFDVPMVAYNVSGEYAMIKAAAMAGLIDERGTALEMLLSMKRAGADIIISYYAVDAANWLKQQ